MAEAVFEHGGHRDPKERRARYLERVRVEGRRLRTASDALAHPPGRSRSPSDEELDAFIDETYQARDRDRDRA